MLLFTKFTDFIGHTKILVHCNDMSENNSDQEYLKPNLNNVEIA